MLKVEDLQELYESKLLNLAKLAEKASIPYGTLYSKIKNSTPLSGPEIERLTPHLNEFAEIINKANS